MHQEFELSPPIIESGPLHQGNNNPNQSLNGFASNASEAPMIEEVKA